MNMLTNEGFLIINLLILTITVIVALLIQFTSYQLYQSSKRARLDLNGQIATIHSQMTLMKKSEERLTKTQDFVNHLATGFFSDAYIQSMDILQERGSLEAPEFRQLAYENSYHLFLKHPDTDERRRAIFGLRAIGDMKSHIALTKVVNDIDELPELRLLAQKALKHVHIQQENPS
ncbi:MAG: hypothetical protein ACRBF0_15270 [Calditrichia bacterium]